MLRQAPGARRETWGGWSRTRICPDLISYGAVASSCEKDAQWQLALLLLRDYQQKKPLAIGAISRE